MKQVIPEFDSGFFSCLLIEFRQLFPNISDDILLENLTKIYITEINRYEQRRTRNKKYHFHFD